jgi:hypothetical protein
LLLKVLITHIGTAVVHVLGSTAMQQTLAAMMKKFILVAISGAVMHFLTVHFGAALVGVSTMWVVLPIIGAYMAYKIHEFPKELGEKVSKECAG